MPDLRLETLPLRFDELLAGDLPLEPAEVGTLQAFAARFAEGCAELAAAHPVASVQHDDLHGRSVFDDGASLRVLDWGDASIGQPLFSFVRLDLSLTETVGAAIRDRWLPRLRDAYLEPWGPGARQAFDLAHRLGRLAHTFTWNRHRAAMPTTARHDFDQPFASVLRHAMAGLPDL